MFLVIIKERMILMHVKKLICKMLSAAMLFTAVFVQTANAWSVYDTDYGMEGYEQSKTVITDDMEQLRQEPIQQRCFQSLHMC